MDKRVDLNCDMGEIADLVNDGTQDALLRFVTSVNVSCGAHAGDADTIARTIQSALRAGVAIGAHPGYADKANFGRVALALRQEELIDSIYGQLVSFEEIAARCGARVAHVKPHGALYNEAARNAATAKAIARAVAGWRQGVLLMGLDRSPMLDVFRAAGFPVAGEAFADRAYEPDGALRSRSLARALIHDPAAAAEQALRLAESGAATICIHSDTKGSVAIAEAVSGKLRAAGWEVTACRVGPTPA